MSAARSTWKLSQGREVCSRAYFIPAKNSCTVNKLPDGFLQQIWIKKAKQARVQSENSTNLVLLKLLMSEK